ncbi:antitoxin YefM [Aquiflexum balticum DSM 16537]|uniref:Antitoxin n=1 Tax=Aquiflexum balticum DSM 16537 TaxID=758820 RepID=A0A1W2GZ49_9BACT|nr:type II toxin-antitoxin system prevent-host-death family antitoxin [Aquiflexum balticum]SMD41618.1 antitoxin YefM [Aquiflexum balticum DSM 16537]
MEITTYTKFKQNLKTFLDKVSNDQSLLYVTRTNGEDVVVLSKADYESLVETFYLLKSPKNVERLLKGIREFEKGVGEENNLIE